MRLDNICFLLGSLLITAAALTATHLWQSEGPLELPYLTAMMLALGLGTALTFLAVAPRDDESAA